MSGLRIFVVSPWNFIYARLDIFRYLGKGLVRVDYSLSCGDRVCVSSFLLLRLFLKPAIAPPRSEPMFLSLFVPNSMATIASMIRSCQILIPLSPISVSQVEVMEK